MREHIEILVESLAAALRERRAPHRAHPTARSRRIEPRRRRPRTARSTYVPVRQDLAEPARFAH